MTSNHALQRVKRLFRARKAGHTGSLDPIATGLLPICFGKATKISQGLLDADKRYRTVAWLGIQTNSGDKEGTIIANIDPPHYSLEHLEAVLVLFRGEIVQTPPMHSAIKHQGQPLYKFARRGIEIARPARAAFVQVLKILDWHYPFLSLEIHVSKGTYIRTLVEELGKTLGCGAHVKELRRIGVGKYSAQHMVSLGRLEEAAESDVTELDNYLITYP